MRCAFTDETDAHGFGAGRRMAVCDHPYSVYRSEHHALDLKLGSMKIEDQSHRLLHDPQVVEHLRQFIVSSLGNGLALNDHLIANDEVRLAIAHWPAMVKDGEAWLLEIGKALLLKIDYQRVLIRFFTQAGPQLTMDSHCAADNLVG